MKNSISVVLVVTIISFSFLATSTVLAQALQLSVDKNSGDVNSPFLVTVSIEGSQVNGQVSIDGLELFTVEGQSQSTMMRSVNGVNQVSTQLQLQLRAQESGNYVLGPARMILAGESVSSNIINVEVTGEKLFVGSPPVGRTGGSQEQGGSLSDGGALEEGTEYITTNDRSRSVWWIVLLLVGVGGATYRLRSRAYSQNNSTLTDQITDQSKPEAQQADNASTERIPPSHRPESDIPDINQWYQTLFHWIIEYVEYRLVMNGVDCSLQLSYTTTTLETFITANRDILGDDTDLLLEIVSLLHSGLYTNAQIDTQQLEHLLDQLSLQYE